MGRQAANSNLAACFFVLLDLDFVQQILDGSDLTSSIKSYHAGEVQSDEFGKFASQHQVRNASILIRQLAIFSVDRVGIGIKAGFKIFT
jgi:hypothetical protein